MGSTRWTDLLDPTEEELRQELPGDFQGDDLAEILRAPTPDAKGVRPTLRPRGAYVFGVLLLAVAVP